MELACLVPKITSLKFLFLCGCFCTMDISHTRHYNIGITAVVLPMTFSLKISIK